MGWTVRGEAGSVMPRNASGTTSEQVAIVSTDERGSLHIDTAAAVLAPQLLGSPPAPPLCLGLHDVFIALFLVMLILMTICGNVLVVLSVFVYKRMRTFTNILLTSLATADLLVGLVIMPLSLLDLLHSRIWPLGRFLCGIWATTDVLLCTASILNLCVISLDRYMAITSPLKYPRTRSRKMAATLLGSVWLLSFVICTPPWLVPGWGVFTHYSDHDNSTTARSALGSRRSFACVYSPSIPYRIYSALGSFYIPLLVMLSVYFKIFRVASEREALLRKSLGTYRLSQRIFKSQLRNDFLGNQNHRCNQRCGGTANAKGRIQASSLNQRYAQRPSDTFRNQSLMISLCDSRLDSTDLEDSTLAKEEDSSSEPNSSFPRNNTNFRNVSLLERECHSLANLADAKMNFPPSRKTTDANSVPALSKKAQLCHNRLQPQNLLAQAQIHYQTYGPGKIVRGSKEKMVYLRERKAFKTIGIVILGFVICWMPFFVLYIIEVCVNRAVEESAAFSIISELFLWLGYSNSVLNPIIYTMYNGDFRRCFRDLLSFGCIQHHRRTMSVKKLHQQSTNF